MHSRAPVSILVVDDDAYVLESTSMLLSQAGYAVTTSTNALDALAVLNGNGIEVTLTDIKMPGMSGIDLLERIHAENHEMPVILMTAYAELNMAVEAVKKGAFDFMIKPFKPDYLSHTIAKAVKYAGLIRMEKEYKRTLEDTVRKRTQELSDALAKLTNMNKELITRLTAVAEYRDTDTGAHIARIGLYANRLAEALGLTRDVVDLISFASPMHDIGKIGIPDSILLKPAVLSLKEFEVMKSHSAIGEQMLRGSSYAGIKVAASIALTHHERWDGTGYPRGLKGTDIPIEGRIVNIVDQYDALRSRRPYKRSFTHDEAFAVITAGDDRTSPSHFDPAVVQAFVGVAADFNAIFEAHQDAPR
jgi:putative two-component system response regulator